MVALPGGGFLMLMTEDVDEGGVLLRSADGRTWDRVDARAAGLDAVVLVDLAADDTTAMVLGMPAPRAEDGSPTGLAVWTSVDGRAWTRIPDGGALLDIVAEEVAGSHTGFAAIGRAPTILLSGPDGSGWRRTTVPEGALASLYTLAADGDGFVATGSVNDRPAVWRSAGAGWFRLRLPDTDAVSRISAVDARFVAWGTVETPDPLIPDTSTSATVAWESNDDGSTWASLGLPLGGAPDLSIVALDGGFLAVLAPNPSEMPLSAWRSIRPGVWEPVALADGGTGFDRPYVSSVAVSGRRVVLAGNTVGTGAGGDRVVVWFGEATGPAP